jgi:phage I-like protein
MKDKTTAAERAQALDLAVFSLFDIQLTPADVEAEGAKPLQLFQWGENHPVDGRPPVLVDDAWATAATANFAARKVDYAVDYNHASILGYQDAPAAGWITALTAARPGEGETPDPAKHGIWLSVQWTPRGRQRIKDGEYRYASAVLARDRDTGATLPMVVGCALTNTPAIHGLQVLAASEDRLASTGGSDESADDGAKGEGAMDVLKEVGYASVEELKSVLSELPKLREKAGKADQVETLSAQLAEANKRADTAEAGLKVARVDAAMARAEALGRIPAESEKLTDEQKAARVFARKLAEKDEELFSAWLKGPAPAAPAKPAPAGKLTPDTSGEQKTREAAATFSMEADPSETEIVSRAVALSRAEKIPLEAALARIEKEGVH